MVDNRGTIRGMDAAIESNGGRFSLTNSGTIDGIIDLNATIGNVNDKVTNKGTITGNVFLGDGNDSFNGAASKSAVRVSGEDGNDTLRGGNKNDTLRGGAGNDVLTGELGRDTMFGGTGNNRFDFNSIKESKTGAQRDKIMEFQRGPDHIDLEDIDAKTGVNGNQTFTFIGKKAFSDKKGELRYEDKGATVIVQGDTNGDGKVDFEIFVKVGSLAKGDFFL